MRSPRLQADGVEAPAPAGYGGLNLEDFEQGKGES
jgi:hypothetical protein